MVLRCSLLGHDYGDVDAEREREERGSEVVVTVREYEECARCGDKHVVSENTEVRSISRTGADPRPDEPEPQPTPRSAEPPAAEPGDGGAGEFTAEPGETDATFIDADDAGSDPTGAQRSSPAGVEGGAPGTEPADSEPAGAPGTEPAGSEPVETGPAGTEPADFGAPDSEATGDPADTGIELPTDENGDPVTDDGEILEDDGSTTADREYGEWPDSSDVGPPVERGTDGEPDDWPDRESEPLEDDAILLDTGTEAIEASSSGVETEPGPEIAGSNSTADGPPVATGGEATADTEPDVEPGSGIERASEAPTPGNEGGIPGGDGQAKLHCPRCGFTAGSDRSSLRTGDICPDCRMGYLGVQPDR